MLALVVNLNFGIKRDSSEEISVNRSHINLVKKEVTYKSLLQCNYKAGVEILKPKALATRRTEGDKENVPKMKYEPRRSAKIMKLNSRNKDKRISIGKIPQKCETFRNNRASSALAVENHSVSFLMKDLKQEQNKEIFRSFEISEIVKDPNQSAIVENSKDMSFFVVEARKYDAFPLEEINENLLNKDNIGQKPGKLSGDQAKIMEKFFSRK